MLLGKLNLPRNTLRTTLPIRLHSPDTWGEPQPGPFGAGGFSWRCFGQCHPALAGSGVLVWDAGGGVTSSGGTGWHVLASHHLAAGSGGPSPPDDPHRPPCRLRGLQQVSAGGAGVEDGMNLGKRDGDLTSAP